MKSLAGAIETVLREKRRAIRQQAAYMQYADEDDVEVLEINAVPGQPDRNLYLIDRVLTAGECKQIVQIAESAGMFEHYTSPKSPEYAYRDHHRVKFVSPGIADVLWTETGLQKAFQTRIRHDCIHGEAVGLNPCIKLYRYQGPECFGRHIDGSEVVCGADGAPAGRTEYTVLFYLSTTVGGDTVFYDDDGNIAASVVPEQGRVAVHRHGDHSCLDHEALVVTSGTKYVLRTDVVFGYNCI